MSRKPRNLTTNVSQPGGARRAQRKQQQHGNKRGKGRAGGGSFGTFGLLCAVAGAWIVGVATAWQKRRRKLSVDGSVLTSMLAKPLSISEHAKCRMDCRYQASSTNFALDSGDHMQLHTGPLQAHILGGGQLNPAGRQSQRQEE